MASTYRCSSSSLGSVAPISIWMDGSPAASDLGNMSVEQCQVMDSVAPQSKPGRLTSIERTSFQGVHPA